MLIRKIDRRSTINPIIKKSNRNTNKDESESYYTPIILNNPTNPNTNAHNINEIEIITIMVIEMIANALVKKVYLL